MALAGCCWRQEAVAPAPPDAVPGLAEGKAKDVLRPLEAKRSDEVQPFLVARKSIGVVPPLGATKVMGVLPPLLTKKSMEASPTLVAKKSVDPSKRSGPPAKAENCASVDSAAAAEGRKGAVDFEAKAAPSSPKAPPALLARKSFGSGSIA